MKLIKVLLLNGVFFVLMLAATDFDRLLCGQILNIDGINAHKF